MASSGSARSRTAPTFLRSTETTSTAEVDSSPLTSQEKSDTVPSNEAGDEKNIRRRVYDALNVLIAINVIERDKDLKLLRWNGLSGFNCSDDPIESHPPTLIELQLERDRLKASVELKTTQVEAQMFRLVCQFVVVATDRLFTSHLLLPG